MTYRIDITNPAEYQAVQYKGANFMCVQGSPRAKYLREANTAWRLGYDALERELFNKAIESIGCAFEHREAQLGGNNGR